MTYSSGNERVASRTSLIKSQIKPSINSTKVHRAPEIHTIEALISRCRLEYIIELTLLLESLDCWMLDFEFLNFFAALSFNL